MNAKMKINTKKRGLTFLMVLAMMVGLVACGGSGKNPAGTYNLVTMESGGEEMNVTELADLFGTEIDVTLELKDDESFTLDMGFLSDGESTSGTWKMDGDSLILTAEGDERPVTYDGETIVMDLEGESLTFEKQ